MASSKKDASEILYGRGDVQQIKDKSDNDNNILLFGDENENLDHQGDIHPNFDGDRAKLDILQKLEEDPNYRGPGTDQVETWTGLNLKGLGCRIPESLSRCKNLRMLDVSNNTQMDEEQIVNICSLKTLEELDMSNSNISTISPDIILPKHLKKLDLSQNQLTDLPLPLCDLANLRELDLKGNKIASITPQLKQLCSLKKLDLSSNPLEEFPLEVCKIKTLENISMKNTGYVSVPKKITLLQNLKELSMSSNSLKKFPPYLCGLKTLESLDLSENEITTVPSEIKELKDMKILNLSHNKLGELPLPVCALVRLETLDLENNQISTLPPEISQLKSLKKLNLSDKNFKEFPLSVCKLIRLEALSFRNTNITTVPSQITQLRSVKQLNLSNNKLEELPLPLCELVGLETLYLEGNKFITVPPQISQLKNLKQLNLSNNKLEKIPSPVCELVRLETLGLRNNEITTVSPQVTPLKNLKQLDLSNNKLEELQLPLCELVGLETLYLEGNKFITVPPQISQLKNLKQLNLSNNELIKIPSPVCELVRLEALSLPGNNITSVPPQITQLKNLKQLDLSYNMLKELPFTVCELVRLETLSFWMNKITTVPPEIAQLKNLKRLYLFNNKLEELPLPVCELVRLETLSLQNNQITTVPPQISQLKNLKYLYLYSNKLEELPLPVCELVRLETLDLHNNQITRVPPQITQLKNLKKLYLSNNKLEELPLPVCELVSLETLDLQNNQITTVIPEISQLKKLKQLKLSNNKLEELPLPVCKLVRLETLDIENNQITTVPPQISQLKNLLDLNLIGNILIQPPQEVADRGKDAVFRYFDDLIKSRATSSSRLQVNILGETCAGKTSLVKTLTSGSPFLTTTSDRTHVMEQIQWSPKEDVFLNINDFGGHEVYKVAHNFFITKEAITLIVFNLQDVSLKYNDIVRSWIDNVHSRAQDSTILLVGSHADRLNNEELETRKKQVLRALRFHLRDKAFELRTILEELEKRGAFRKPYPEAYNEKMKRIKMLIQNPPYINRSVFVTSSQTGYGMVELKEELIRRAKEKKFVLPETWLQMVEHIETAKKNGQYHFLTLESLATMAEKTPPQMQRGGESQRIEDVLNFLHATGVVLWFRDKPLLKNFIFHRQDVFIDILRAVLCHDMKSVLVYDTDPFNKKYTERKFESAKKDVLQRGVISKTMLECLWWRFNFENPGLDAMIELLKKFEICYVVKRADENRYHFPWLLNEDRPNCISSKWPSLPSREKLQISTEVHFPTACPPGLYEMAAVHLHGFLGHYKSTSQDWKDGFYAELDSQFQMCFERRLSGRSTNGVLRLSIRGENPAQLKEHSLVIFQDLVALVEREFPGSPRDEFLVCPHCVREEKDPPTLFDAPKSILNVPLEEPAPYHPCPEEDPNNLASADFFFPVTKGKMTTLHCTSLDKHVNHTVKIIRGTFNSLRKILSRLSKSGMLTEEEKTTFLDPDEDFRLSTFLKAKSDFAFYVFCGALHDSGHPETARMLRLPDLAMELPEDALGEILQKLLDKRVINDQDRDQVWRESDKEQRVSALCGLVCSIIITTAQIKTFIRLGSNLHDIASFWGGLVSGIFFRCIVKYVEHKCAPRICFKYIV
ncbi:malignant fibrous histiocytoma-amplified sequence 1-like [Lingula anatina]|uniref:non-specific serine/threonine protein kinase n=1 Tax=Lingula anatina TaxID=7574 RepID=A0A1S3HRH2_LINAN|nr:malignant fibrous histiocytoma-amplified sequence 1-like [Lingula anatina]|eukprot:XP_013388151.1 malignant fibrous histiocytoma-amplified sequence 1-like [Lingula anatina]